MGRPGGVPVTDPLITKTITITEELTEDGVHAGLSIEPEDADLVSVLGLLRLAEDSAIRMAMGDDQ
jgi:hypothetical protein